MTRALLLLVAIAACDRAGDEPRVAPVEDPQPVTVRRPSPEVAALFAKFECNRCHEVPGVAAPGRDKQCFGCHQQVFDGTFPAKPDSLARWKPRVDELRHAPSLAHADRLRREWVETYLLDPHDMRPGSVAQMPRLPLEPREASMLATFLVPDANNTPTALDASRGEALYKKYACARCHRFTGAPVDDPAAHTAGAQQTAPLDAAWRLAPDLRHARDRLQPAKAAEWIARPRGAMPVLGVSDDDARALAAYILTVGLQQTFTERARFGSTNEGPPRYSRLYLSVLDRVRPLERPVTWAEVERVVFRDTCWHCHAVPDFARGDGGPGNTGGFGFRGRGLDVSSYAGISSGSLDDHGERRSVFAALSKEDPTPRLVAQLVARHLEEAGHALPGVYGMPLGLPALPYDKIQLISTWIAQGRPN